MKAFLWLIILGVIAAWLSWAMIIVYFDPGETSLIGFSLFYISLFLGLSGTIFLAGDAIKSKILKKQLYPRVQSSVRHGIFFTMLIVGWVFLKSQDLANWWNILLYVLILAVLEFFFISSQKRKYNFYDPSSETSN
ncbi:hypothetical protein HYZ76_00395 [Candidatus Falkowbacteria bacterium]|nr:hypothetical protein [Candidatus Falkowbacteria bacterium]